MMMLISIYLVGAVTHGELTYWREIPLTIVWPFIALGFVFMVLGAVIYYPIKSVCKWVS